MDKGSDLMLTGGVGEPVRPVYAGSSFSVSSSVDRAYHLLSGKVEGGRGGWAGAGRIFCHFLCRKVMNLKVRRKGKAQR